MNRLYPGQRVTIRSWFSETVSDLSYVFLAPDGTRHEGTPEQDDDGSWVSSALVDQHGDWRWRVAGVDAGGEAADEGRFHVEKSLIPPEEP